MGTLESDFSKSRQTAQPPSIDGDCDHVGPEVAAHAQCMLDSMGDAVLSTDLGRRVTYLNAVAEQLTGWTRQEAVGRYIRDVLQLIDAETRQPARSPVAMAIRTNSTLGLTTNCLLVRRDGTESAIEDSTAPIRDASGLVTGAVMVFRNVTESRARMSQLSHLARHDGLTQLANRTLFDESIARALKLAQRHKQRIGVLLLDLDFFKDVNDRLGHPVGDRVLQSAAQRMKETVRDSDIVCRLGGDEFAILLSEIADEQDAALCAEKLLMAIGAPHVVDGIDLRVSASIGIATYPDDGEDALSLMKHADLALYRAKSHGRGNFKFFGRARNTRADERHDTESRLRLAFARKEFVLEYQPIFDLSSHSICGVEALVRWRDPERGLTLPGAFVALAEECGLIVPLGRWVLEEACRQCRLWQQTTLPNIGICVNVSAAELRESDYVAGVAAILASTGLDPRYLVLELTESVLVLDAASTSTVLRALKELGVRLALDDFGTGFSSLSHLKHFPIDTLKIDKSFVQDVMTDPVDAGIVSAIVGMADSLQLSVVAEGVETTQQLDFLQGQGCPQAQGYFLGRPADAGAITDLLWRGRWDPASVLQVR